MFNKNLKLLRNKRGLNQADLGSMLDISGKTISSWEQGRTEPNMKQLATLSEIFNVSLEDFINKDLSLPDNHNLGDHETNLEHLKDKPELFEIYKNIYESENLQLLFDTSRDLTPQELEKVLNVIKIIHDED